MPNTPFIANSSSAILPCNCSHPYQDSIYGRGKRLCNPTAKSASKDRINIYRCTACGKERDA